MFLSAISFTFKFYFYGNSRKEGIFLIAGWPGLAIGIWTPFLYADDGEGTGGA